MDSEEPRQTGLKVWRPLFGGSVLAGRMKLYGFLALFLVVGGVLVVVFDR